MCISSILAFSFLQCPALKDIIIIIIFSYRRNYKLPSCDSLVFLSSYFLCISSRDPPDSCCRRTDQTLINNVCVYLCVVSSRRSGRPTRSWPESWPEASGWTSMAPAETRCRARAATAARPTRPAAPRTPSPHKVHTHTRHSLHIRINLLNHTDADGSKPRVLSQT